MAFLPEIFSVKDKNAIVSGGHTGLGKAIAEALLEAGAHVAVCSRRPEKWAESFAELKSTASQHDRQLLSFKCDVTNQTQVEEMVSQVVSKLGSVEILVNNAGIAWIAPRDQDDS